MVAGEAGDDDAIASDGLRVGEVTSIDIMPSDPGKVVATIEVDRKTPMKTDTKARLESLGATHCWTIEDYHVVLADPEGNEFCLLNPKYYEPEPAEVPSYEES